MLKKKAAAAQDDPYVETWEEVTPELAWEKLGNVFWKTNSKMSDGVRQAGILVGTTAPCVLASRADTVDTKLNSIAEAVMSVK